MPRNAEMTRQWKVLLALESHRFGRTITELAELLGVTTRTIRRDLEALQEAGFPVYDQDVDHHRRWKLDALPLRSFAETGLSLAELSALYFSRTLVECLTASAFQADVRSAFDKLAKLLPPKMRRYLGVLPAVMGAKREPGRKVEPGNGHESQKITARPDGSLTLVMNVCTDWALQGWVLSFGPAARVVAPRKLAARILEEIEEARTRYLPRLPFDAAPGSSGDRAQRRLPLGSRRSARTRPSRTATGGSTPPGRRPQG
jgi:predicted DNA-binding transcriptional regulator YafY